MRDELYQRAEGRWASIMMQLGMGWEYLNSRKNGPCPMCGGKDRFRFTDFTKRGDFWCNNCGHGSGLDLVMTWKQCRLGEAVKLVESVIGGAPVRYERAFDPQQITKQKQRMAALWSRGYPLDGRDIASRYLSRRLDVGAGDYPSAALRWAADVPYWGKEKGSVLGYYQVMLAKYVAPDSRSATLQRLWLEEPGEKAKVPVARSNMPGPIPEGGAVRLGEPAEVMGIAEGVESALAATLWARNGLRREMPVWAALSAGGLLKFCPPPECKMLYIFEDYDPSHTGEAVSGALAQRLAMRKDNPLATEVMRKKGPAGDGVKWDWADEWAYAQHQRRGGKIRFGPR